MTNLFRALTQGVPTSTCQLAFLMWETAFRQQGMVLDHCIKVENQAFALFRATTARMMPSEAADEGNGEAESLPGDADSTIIPDPLDTTIPDPLSVTEPAARSADVEDLAPRKTMPLQAEALAPVVAKRARKAQKRVKVEA